tara:strand:+ start:465 stop:767 length:303 start_codon:yes stop_codon:yes gene_type:complete
MANLGKSILAIKSDAKFSINGEDINEITWHDNNPTNITNEQILAKEVELQTAYDNLKYQRNRKEEYPSIEECVHAILDDNLVALQEKRTAVKLKYPKENS